MVGRVAVYVLIAILVATPFAAAQTASVYPDGGTVWVRPNQSGGTATFTLSSGSMTQQTYSLEWVCYSGGLYCGRVGGSTVTFTYTTSVDITCCTFGGSGQVIQDIELRLRREQRSGRLLGQGDVHHERRGAQSGQQPDRCVHL